MLNTKSSFRVFNGLTPTELSRVLPYSVTFDATEKTIDLTLEQEDTPFSFIQAVYIDNTNNPYRLHLTFQPTAEYLVIEPGASGTVPVFNIANAGQISLTTEVAAGQTVNLVFLNFPTPYYMHGPVSAGEPFTYSATIASGASLSDIIDCRTGRLGRIIMPAAWTTANIGIQTSHDGINFQTLFDASGNEYAIVAAAARDIIVTFADFMSAPYLRLRSGSSGSPVNQAADRSVIVQLVP